MLWSTIPFHAGLGGTVLAVGAFVMWEGAPLVGTLTFAMAATCWWSRTAAPRNAATGG